MSEETTYRADRAPLVASGQADCHVRDMTATFAADLPLAQIQAILGEHHQWLPVDGDPRQPIGSLISVDTTGPLRLGYGAWRDLVLGVQFTNGKGELITAGGRTVKNVAGYDLTKFMVGQQNIFGKLVTVTTRTYRRPAGAISVKLAPEPSVVGRLIPTPLRPHWALLTPDALWLGYLGDPEAIAFYQRSLSPGLQNLSPSPGTPGEGWGEGLRAAAHVGLSANRRNPLPSPLPEYRARGPEDGVELQQRSLDDDITHRAGLWNAEGPLVFRASIPPARLSELAPSIPSIKWSAADAAFGIVVGAVESESQAELVTAAAASLQGTIKLSAGLFGKIISLTTTAAERQLLERLKAAFDPRNTLDPLPWNRQ